MSQHAPRQTADETPRQHPQQHPQQEPQQDPREPAGEDTVTATTGTVTVGEVEAWLDWSEASDLLGQSVSKVRQLIREHQLAAIVPAPGEGQKIPAALIMDGQVVKGVPGVLTVLHDAGFDDREAIRWLFTPDDSLPGRPIDALRENRGSEVKRRAQVLGF